MSFHFDIALNEMIRQIRGTEEPFDLVRETWWDSGAGIVQRLQKPDAGAANSKLSDMRYDRAHHSHRPIAPDRWT